jgi:hypothetical protein
MQMVDLAFAHIVRALAGIVVAIVALSVIFVVLDANASNGIVSTVDEWASTLTGPV